MDLVESWGEPTPVLPFPGGRLLLGTAADGVFHLRNEEAEPYRLDGMSVHLNPHFVVTDAGEVQLLRDGAGRVSGQAFADAGDLDLDARTAVFAALRDGLAEAFARDPELVRHVRVGCAEADAERARDRLATATRELLAALDGALAAEAGARAVAAGEAPARPDDTPRPTLVVVADLPGSCGAETLAAALSAAHAGLGLSRTRAPAATRLAAIERRDHVLMIGG